MYSVITFPVNATIGISPMLVSCDFIFTLFRMISIFPLILFDLRVTWKGIIHFLTLWGLSSLSLLLIANIIVVRGCACVT